MRRCNAETQRKSLSWSLLPLSLFLVALFLSACDSIPAPPSATATQARHRNAHARRGEAAPDRCVRHSSAICAHCCG